MSDEKVDVKKFAQGFIHPVDWWKAASIGIKIAVFIAIALVIWKIFFSKTTTVNVGRGGTAIINQERKRFFIPFVEGSVGQNNDSKMNTGIRAGLRFEF